jgi:hypothetical protein
LRKRKRRRKRRRWRRRWWWEQKKKRVIIIYFDYGIVVLPVESELRNGNEYLYSDHSTSTV